MDGFFSCLLKQTGWLYTKIFENNFFFIDYWTFPHIWSGLVIFFILAALGTKHKIFWLVFLLSSYEIIEILLEIFAMHIFKPEVLKDKLTDIITGVLGGLLGFVILKWMPLKEKPDWITKNSLLLFSSITLSFLWVGNYQYQYNILWMNLPGLNLWAFTIWMAGGYIFLNIYLFMKKSTGKIHFQIMLSWLIYFFLLILIEFFGYHFLKIRETSLHEKRPLLFGLIHGNLTLHLYYIFFPFIIILFYETTLIIVKKARLNMLDPSLTS